MDIITQFFQAVLGFLLALLTLFINFWIDVLNLILNFARSIVGISY